MPATRAFVSSAALLLLALSSCKDDEPARPKTSAATRAQPPKKGPAQLACSDDAPKTEKGGKVLGCVVTNDVKIGPVTCAAGKRVELYADGKLAECTLVKPHAWDGVPCAAGQMAKWARSGKLVECGLDKPYERSGLDCRDRIALQENGKVDRCQLYAAVKLGRIELPARSWVSLDAEGKPSAVQYPPDQPQVLESYRCSEIHYYPSGQAKRCITAAMSTLEGRRLSPQTHLCFDEAGKLTTTGDERCLRPK